LGVGPAPGAAADAFADLGAGLVPRAALDVGAAADLCAAPEDGPAADLCAAADVCAVPNGCATPDIGACAPLLACGFALAVLPPCDPPGALAWPLVAGESHVDDSLTSLLAESAWGDPAACAVGCGPLGSGGPLGCGGPEVPAAPFAV
jgi:hypothetical protein